MLFQIIFWSAVFLPFYAYLGYPLVLLALRLVIRRDVKKQPITPFVSLLIPAYNEADVIERKIENSLALDYPADRMEIVVASDGSSDETAAIARSPRRWQRIRVLAFAENRGKVATLNASVPELRGEIVVFSDAPAMLYPDSVRRLVENFADPEVGAVSGLYKVVKADAGEHRQLRGFLLEVRNVSESEGIATGFHAGRSRPSARHPQGALSVSRAGNN